MEIQDHSPYPFTVPYKDARLPEVCIGWIGSADFPVGQVSEAFLDRLFEFLVRPTTRTKMPSTCKACQPPREITYCKTVSRGARQFSQGFSEARVIGTQVIYVVPDMIYHYITRHGYKPPDDFIDAVFTSPLPRTKEYKAFKYPYWE